MTPDEARFYAGHSVESDPAGLGELLEALPQDPRSLLNAVAGLILDRAFVGPLQAACPPESADDAESRRIPAMLTRILARGPGSLATARPPEQRLIGACRHYALLACSALRHHGVPRASAWASPPTSSSPSLVTGPAMTSVRIVP